MQRIHMDFVNARRPVGTAGWLLLTLGVIAAVAVVAWNHLYWQPLNTAGEERLRSLHAAIDGHRSSASQLKDAQLVAEWTRAIDVADKLNLPWAKLFDTLEHEVDRPVAILSLEPDAGKREISITAEARNFEEMLAYYRQLQQQNIFADLSLHTHQVNRLDREHPIRFRITATWIAKS